MLANRLFSKTMGTVPVLLVLNFEHQIWINNISSRMALLNKLLNSFNHSYYSDFSADIKPLNCVLITIMRHLVSFNNQR